MRTERALPPKSAPPSTSPRLLENGFVESLPPDALLAGLEICQAFRELREALGNSESDESYRKYVYALALFKAYCSEYNQIFPVPALKGTPHQNILEVQSLFQTAKSRIEHLLHLRRTEEFLEQSQRTLAARFHCALPYELLPDEIDRVQILLAELREMLLNSEILDQRDRSRLLNRLDRIQGDLHQRLSDLDRFWGLVIDAGIVVGKFGEKLAALSARNQELLKIIWRVQTAQAGLEHTDPPASPIPQDPVEPEG